MNNKFFPSNFLFIMIMFMGTLFSLSSTHWLTMWMGLELNLMGFLPLMNIKGKMLEAEASMKYFIIQSLSSSMLIISSIMMYYKNLTWYSMFMNNNISLLIILSLILKMGGAPIHFWLPSITKKMSWSILFLLLTWQKLAPLFMMSLMNSNLYLIMIISMLSTMMGSMMALNQTNIQLILTYSSISHLGWMISMITINSSITLIYFMNYIIISIPLLSMLSKMVGDHLYMFTQKNNKDNMILISLILSLAGLPPLLGFMSKLMILISLIQMNLILLILILFIGTLISLYFYLNMSLMLMIKSYMMFMNINKKNMYNFIISFNITSMIIIYPLIMMFVKYAMTIFYKS
uniref:NADH dehydrogenase subunit 2 n=1 Tax=Pyroteuthis margaritifera TaxID=283053 RepID=UPI00286D5A6C|nr:NADH dehydrogenase subunit 2 [Pyroteuthis margaritifera]WMC20907.1 NADH dehydrogenase subunit 2 [Pyroteuthis margaritifera]